ncbi:MAG TPA: hypothetical protein VI198_03415, partial [Candidatus Eisenbacteria bacterium]
MPTSRTPAAVLLAALVLLLAAPTSAQYMYLDANGDGVHSSADVVAPSGTTAIDIWLRTDANRDGSAGVCPTGETFTIASYEFILRASNGAATWGAYTNHQTDMTIEVGVASTATEYHNGFAGSTILPPGLYRLGTLVVSPALGTPALEIVALSSIPGGGSFLTSFGSSCLGPDLDNTMKLGADWFDVDGLPYGGMPQAAPVLAPIADMTVGEGGSEVQAISASDGDGQPLLFEKSAGPPYMSVATAEPGTGLASGTITLVPGQTDAGIAVGTVRVTDGVADDSQSFGITVLDVDIPPLFTAPDEVTVGGGAETEVRFFIRDP